MFDLNNLKLVNGNLGHEMGDKYIEAFSALLASLQNDRISAYRVGGDEFSVIMEKTNAVEIHKVLDKLEKAVEKYNVKHNIKISYARGYEISTRDHYYLMGELTKRAYSNMYRNKQTTKHPRMNMEKSV